MKKSLLALAALTAFAGVASAQSSVTLFGIVDLSARGVDNGIGTRSTINQDGNSSSRLGFRGVEDLGGGLKAGFWIEGALSADTGNATGQTWQRRSTVSLMGGFGEIRLGRDYTPVSYTHLDVYKRQLSPCSSTSPPRAATASTLSLGVVTGITTTARQFRRLADNATPWAWLPALAQITPRASASAGSLTILL